MFGRKVTFQQRAYAPLMNVVLKWVWQGNKYFEETLVYPILASRLLTGYTPRNWNFPRDLMLGRGKKKKSLKCLPVGRHAETDLALLDYLTHDTVIDQNMSMVDRTSW